jgi:ubiquinone/menaquinone biosynthesis C-methylase UbiE
MLGDYTKVSLPSSYYDGIYTMETIMHVSDTPACLKKFYKAMKPGGKLVLHEYSHAGEAKMPPKIFKQLTVLNEQSAMPSMQKFEHGVLEKMIKDAGFRYVTVQDISNRIQPMVFGFYLLAVVPYAIFKIFGIEKHLTNASAAVFMRRQRKYWRYNVFTAVK